MAKLGNLYLDGKFPISTNRLNHFDRLFGQALFGGVEKSVDYAPIISVSDALAKPAIDLQCKITAVQSGSGDPSPQNIRNIVGWNGLSLFRGSSVSVENKEIVISAVQSGEGNPSPTNIRPISAGLTIEMDDSSTLTVWGGLLNPYESKITVTFDICDLGSLSWSFSSLGGGRVYASKPDILQGQSGTAYLDIISNKYKSVSWAYTDNAIERFNAFIRVRDSSFEGMTTTEVRRH